ncbi:MAG TPA: HYR domain-containing protein [Thermoanaerobaculia bacterium]|nr:HYR domain-containing protein [Thermoanaerobaculia bacterium]
MRILTPLCAILVATTILAQNAPPPVINSVTPEKITYHSGEHFITVRGRNFWTWPRALVTISGPAGTSTLESNYWSDSWLEVWVRSDMIDTVGRYSVVVTNPDGGISAPAYFEVVYEPGPILYLSPMVQAEATGPDGANVKFSVQATTTDGLPATITCTHQSGDLFPLGESTVSCTATDERRLTSTSRDFTVNVVDTTPPVLTLPNDFEVEATGPDGAQVMFEATAVDIVDGDVPVNCNPPSGSTFPVGRTTVHCSAFDSHSQSANGEFNVTVTGNANPTLVLPDDIEVETMRDDGEIVTFTATATDRNGQPLPVTCTPASGSRFPIGTTTVQCSATDAEQRTTTGTFDVTVKKKDPPPPPPPPVLTLPDDIVVTATSDDGAVVTFEATAKDGEGMSIAVTCEPPSGSQFPIGSTTVRCSATDRYNQTTSDTFTITVEEPPPPPPLQLNLPDDISVEAMSPSGTVVEYEATAEEDGQEVPVSCEPSSGSLFPVGTTTVVCSATGSDGQTARGSFNVHVLDSNAPVIRSVSATPEVLWPPNGKMTDVTVEATADDEIDTMVDLRVIRVTANEGIGADDWKITGALTLQLRAERNGSAVPRIYTIVVEAIDDSGNSSTATTTVRVPHDGSDAAQPSKKGKRRAVGK